MRAAESDALSLIEVARWHQGVGEGSEWIWGDRVGEEVADSVRRERPGQK